MAFNRKAVVLISLLGSLAATDLNASASKQPSSSNRVQANAQKASATRNSKSNSKNKAKQQTPPAPQPEPVVYTPPPLRPEQMPAVAPRVSYQNGQLTVFAENSNLSDVLNGIRAATGIRIENAGGSGGDRVAAKIGPAPVRDVLLSLLEGSRYDFVMLGSNTDPNQIERVVLAQKSAANGSNQPPPAANNIPQNGVVQSEENTEEGDDNNNEGFAPAPTPPQPNQPQPQPPGATVQPGADQGNAVKTPEQLLQDLRNMDQQRQQQQQQQQSQQPGSPDQPRPPRTSRPQ
jgi:hypothetical protein